MPIAGKGFGVIAGTVGGGGGTTTTAFTISAADFTGSDYSNALLSGKTPMTEFNVTNLGSGTTQTDGIGYTFAGDTLTMTPDDYLIEIY